jgi:hypothetical protein
LNVETARSMLINDPEYWHQRAEGTRVLADLMMDETAKETMLMVAEDCDRFAVMAAIHSVEEVVSRVIDEVRRS